jgi:hypothetical protein
MNRRAALLAFALGAACACACTPAPAPLPQDEFLADGVLVMVPPPPEMQRLQRNEGRGSGHADFMEIATFGADDAGERPGGRLARTLLPSRLSRDPKRHRERLELVRASWLAREQEPPSAMELEARARLAALDAGRADSARWQPRGETRTLVLGVPLADSDAVARLTADMPDAPGLPLVWEIDAFLLVRGRLLQLQVVDLSGAPLAAVPLLRATALGWVDRVRAANRGALHRRGQIGGH